MKVIHITDDKKQYEIVTLIANKINKTNSLSCIYKNEQYYFTGGIILKYDERVTNYLDKIPVEEQYEFVKLWRQTPFVKQYLQE